MRVIRYYPTWCPRCGFEGEMFIAKKPEGSLCFSCAECFWTCDRPEDLTDFEKGYEGVDLWLLAPTREEIEYNGWLRFCNHAEEQDVCRQCGCDLYGKKACLRCEAIDSVE